MAYMVMLVLDEGEQLQAVMDAWEAIPTGEVIFVESTCAQAQAEAPVHIPIRFMFEPLSGACETCTLMVFTIVPDEATVDACTAAAETVIGPLEAAPRAMLAAWPLPIVRGYPKPPAEGD
jgi:hypothetical protein